MSKRIIAGSKTLIKMMTIRAYCSELISASVVVFVFAKMNLKEA